jgi:hypothetical protein
MATSSPVATSSPAEIAQVAVTIPSSTKPESGSRDNFHRNISDDRSVVFSRADRDGNGQLSKEEFKGITATIVEEHIAQVNRQSRVNRRTIIIAIGLFVLLVLSIIGNTAGSLWIVSTQVKTTVGGADDSIMSPKSDRQSIVKTAQPMQEIPLGLASHLDHKGLMSIKRVVVRKQVYNESEFAPDVEEQIPTELYSAYTVVGYDWTSPTEMEFSLHDGSSVFIKDGNTWLFDAKDEVPVSICKTEMESAMFLVDGIDVDALVASMPSRHRARALAQATDGCSDRSYIDAAVEAAFMTGPEADAELSELSSDVDAQLNDDVDAELTDAEALEVLEATVNGSEIVTDNLAAGRQLGTWGRVSGLSAKVRAKYTKANGKRTLIQKAHLLAYKASVKHFTASEGNPNEFNVPTLPEGSPCQPLYSEVNSFLDGMEAVTDAMDAAQVVIQDVSSCLSTVGAPLGAVLKVFATAFKALDAISSVMSKLPYVGGLFKVVQKGMNIAHVQFQKLADKHRDWKKKSLEPVQDVVLDTMIVNAIYAEKMYLSYRMIDVLVSQALVMGETSCPTAVEESGVCRDAGATPAIAAMNRAFPTAAVFDGMASGFRAVHDRATFACGWMEDKAIKNVLYLLEKSGIIDVLTKLKNWITKKHCIKFFGKHCFKLTKVPKIVKKVINGMVDKIIKVLKIDQLIKKMVQQLLGPLKLDKLLAAIADGFPFVPEFLPGWKSFEENMGVTCLTNRAETQTVANAAEAYVSSPTGMPGADCLAPPFDKAAKLSCEATGR